MSLSQQEKIYRKRIVEIALSYVGQYEVSDNRGFYDPQFEDYIRQYGSFYTGGMWCAFFCKMVWNQALNDGNKLVQPIDSIGFNPNINSGLYDSEGQSVILKDLWKYVHPNVKTCANNFKNLKSFTPTSKITSKSDILPGDLIIYKSSRYPDGAHIGVVVYPYWNAQNQLTGIFTAEGNTVAEGKTNTGGAKNDGGMSALRGSNSIWGSFGKRDTLGICRFPTI